MTQVDYFRPATSLSNMGEATGRRNALLLLMLLMMMMIDTSVNGNPTLFG